MIVGIAGLGVMGSAFAVNLLKDGWTIFGYDPDQKAANAARDEGIEPLSSIGDLGSRCDVVLSSLPNDQALQSLVVDLAESDNAPVCLIETSTLSLAAKEQAAEDLLQAGIAMLDCPVSGTGSQGRSANLVVLASGVEEIFETYRPVLEAISRKQIFAGPFGNGMRLKLVANSLITIHIAAAAEALAFAEALGLDLEATVAALSGSPASSSMFDVRAPAMAARSYQPAQMRLELWRKDLDLIAGSAADEEVPHELFQLCADRFRQAADRFPDEDTAAIFELTRKRETPGG